MFLGKYEHTLDNKNRLIIPAKFRLLLKGAVCYVSKGFDACLEVRTLDHFEQWVQKLSNIPEAKKTARALKRKIMAFSEESRCDSVGRIKISSYLLSEVNISKEVIVIGNGDKFEIWDPATWQNYQSENVDIENLADEFSEWI